jgi:Transposase DDE domain
MKVPPLEYDAVHKFVQDLAGDVLHPKQVDSLAHAVVGAIHADVASITAIGRAAARAREVSEKHSIKQVDRMLANSKVDATEVMQHVIPVLVSGRSRIVVAVDWTEFASNGHSTVAVSMITQHGRATPLMWLTVASKKLKKRRSQFEDRLLWRLRLAVPEHVRVTVLADRGFADTGLFWTLKEKMRFDYVIRFKAGTFVESSEGDARTAGDWVPSNGQAKRLDQPLMTRKRRRVPAVVCVKRAGMKEPWCLVTSLTDDDAEEIVQLYSRRFDIEHTFRDQKDWRFGLALDHMTLGTPGRRDRMLLVLALATMFSVIVGAAGEHIGLDRTLRANTETKKRTHSLVRQGHEYMAGVARAVIGDVRRTFQVLWRELRATDRIYALL